MKQRAGLSMVVVAALAAELFAACIGTTTPPSPTAASGGGGAVANDGVATAPAEAVVGDMEPEPEPQLPPLPTTDQAAPAGLLATARIGDPIAFLTAAGEYAKSAQSMVAGLLNPQALVAISAQFGVDLSGVDFARPIDVLVLDPQEMSPPVVVVVGVADQGALEDAAARLGLRVQIRNGVAAIGCFDALVAAGGYAMTTLLAQPSPAMPIADISMTAVMTRYRPLLDMLANNLPLLAPQSDAATAAMLSSMLKMYLSAFDQMDRIHLALELDGSNASIVSQLVPLPDTTLAAFIAQQAPGSFALLDVVGGNAMVMGGKLELSLLGGQMLAMMEPMFRQQYGDAAGPLLGIAQLLYAQLSGESAMTVDLAAGAMSVSVVWELREPSKVSKLLEEQLAAIAKSNLAGVSFTLKKNALRHRGASLAQITVPIAAMAASAPARANLERLYGGKDMVVLMGVRGSRLVTTFGADGDVHGKTKALLDRLAQLDKRKGKAKPATSGALATALADARQRGDSYVMAYDLSAFTSFVLASAGMTAGVGTAAPATDPFVATLGVSGGALTARMTMPASVIAGFTGIKQSSKAAAHP